MSDKKRGSNDNSASNKTPSKGGGFGRRLEEFFKTTKALEKDAEGMADYGKLVDDYAALKKELDATKREAETIRAQKDEEISKLGVETRKLTGEKSTLVDAFHGKCQEFDPRLQAAKSCETKLRQTQDALEESSQDFSKLSESCKDLQHQVNDQATRL